MSNEQGPIDSKSSVVKQRLRLTLPDFVTSTCFFIRFFFIFTYYIVFSTNFLLYIKICMHFCTVDCHFHLYFIINFKIGPKNLVWFIILPESLRIQSLTPKGLPFVTINVEFMIYCYVLRYGKRVWFPSSLAQLCEVESF